MRFTRIAAALLSLAVWGGARAEEYPSRTITLVAPLPAGSGTDAVARVVGANLSEALGAKVVVENKVGASGAIGSASVARAAPDGYTLLIGGTTTHAANPSLLKNLSYDPVKDFTPIGLVGVFPYALIVAADSPYRSLREVIDAAKAEPGKLSFAYANALGQLSGEMLKRRAGIDIAAVPYRGSPQAVTDILGGRVTMIFVDVAPAISLIRSGALRVLAVTTDERTDLIPNAPTMAEAGLPGPRVEAWSGLFAPPGLPRPMVEKLSKAMIATMSKPDVKAHMAGMGFDAQPTTPDAFARRVASEVELWARATAEAGIVPQ